MCICMHMHVYSLQSDPVRDTDVYIRIPQTQTQAYDSQDKRTSLFAAVVLCAVLQYMCLCCYICVSHTAALTDEPFCCCGAMCCAAIYVSLLLHMCLSYSCSKTNGRALLLCDSHTAALPLLTRWTQRRDNHPAGSKPEQRQNNQRLSLSLSLFLSLSPNSPSPSLFRLRT